MTRKIAICLAAFILLLASLIPLAASAATTSNLRLLSSSWGYWFAEDSYYNYDFANSCSAPDSQNVDWAIDIVYFYNADCVKVKNMYFGNAYLDTEFKAFLNDGGGMGSHSDKGTKNWDQWPAGNHMRPYGLYDSGSGKYRLYNQYLLTYCLGSCHHDYPPYYCDEEWTEHFFVSIAGALGCPVWYDYYPFGNYEPVRWEGTHCWDNDGYASRVEVP